MASSRHGDYVLITGCTPGGIGHFLALEFAEKGFNVLATVRDPSKYTSPHPRMTYLTLELTSASSIQSLLAKVKDITGGKLAILYNNAGRNYTVPALDLDLDEVRALYETNLFAVMAMVQAFTPLLIAARGTIVQTGSIAGVVPYAFGSAYNASKAALHSYSDTLRVELAPLGVKVVNVVTGGVRSNIARVHRTLPEKSYYQPIADVYERRLTHSQQVGVDTKVYARRCVQHVLGGGGWLQGRKWYWEGNMSWLAWIVSTLLPRGVADMWNTRTFALYKLRGTTGGGLKTD